VTRARACPPQILQRLTAGHRLVLAGALLSCLFAACDAAPAGTPPQDGRIEPVYDKETGRLQLLRYDANHNGVADTFSYMNGSRVERIEIDVDEDGRIDRWEHYSDGGRLAKVGFSRAKDGREDAWSYAAPDGSISRIEVSSGGDGLVSRTEHYDHERLVSAEEDTDRDGLTDKWESYESGRLARLAFDTRRSGAPTRTLVYEADGRVRIESGADADAPADFPSR
jgi:hypothetical protein